MYDPEVFAHRITLVQQSGRRYTVFECGEYWEPKPVMEIGGNPTKVITVLTTQPVEPESLGKVVAEDVAIVPRFPRLAPGDAGGSGQADLEAAGAEDEPRQSIGAPVLGPELTVVPDVGEVVKLGEKELREESSLRDLRWECKFLRIPHTGPKATLWDRLKKEVAMNQLKVSVQASDAVVEAYTPDVNHGPLPVKPDPQTVMMHELTHIPRADWCEACQAARSREGGHPVVEPKRQVNVISLDFTFNRTGESVPHEEHPMTTQLIAVCHATKYVVCVPLESKSPDGAKHAVEEVVKMASTLGYAELVLRADTEPAMKRLCQLVCLARTRLSLSTEIEEAVPTRRSTRESELKGTLIWCVVWELTLLHTVTANTQRAIPSSHPLYSWSFRHAAFLLTRYKVHNDGCTSFEIVHGRKCDSKIAAFGSTVFCQFVPKKKVKGVAWEKAVYLRKSSLGDLSIVANASGVHYARTIRRAAQVYQADMIVAMKGVPWNATLDVVAARTKGRGALGRVPVVAAPALGEAEPPGDEAASDPPTSTPQASHSPGMSVIDTLDAMEAQGSSSGSSELIPDAMQVDKVEAVDRESFVPFVFRVLDPEQPHGHEDDFVDCDPEEEIGNMPVEDEILCESEEEVFAESAGAVPGDAGMPWSGRPCELGPPELDPEELEKLDEQMKEKEISRLLDMGVLAGMAPEAREGKVKLQCMYVLDWRFRSGWTRRARLVAKEYKFSEPALTDLYSPASVACSRKLLGCMFASSQQLELVSLDVTDAYLQVKQRRQRTGSRDWYDYLAAMLAEGGMETFKGNPAVFATPQQVALNSHVDDMQILGVKGAPMALANKLKDKGLKVKIDGPVDVNGGISHFLKRKFESDEEGLTVTQDVKYAERLVGLLGLEKANEKKTPMPQQIPEPGLGEHLVKYVKLHPVVQKVISLSSAESELMASLLGMTEATNRLKYLMNLIGMSLDGDDEPEHVRVRRVRVWIVLFMMMICGLVGGWKLAMLFSAHGVWNQVWMMMIVVVVSASASSDKEMVAHGKFAQQLRDHGDVFIFVVLTVLMFVVLGCMPPRRWGRWQHDLEEPLGPGENQNQLRSRVHAWFE
ncbi:unnamed protein product, partial [Symbiodinium microadriaticum]